MLIHIKKFIDKVSMIEGKQGKDFVIPMGEARGLRDELAKVLADLHSSHTEQKTTDDQIIQIEINGGTFK